MPLVERWGADTMRLTMLFAGPFEDDIDWKLIAPDPERPSGRLRRGWAASSRAVRDEAVRRDAADGPRRCGGSRTGRSRRVTEDMERFRFNVAISKLHGADERDAARRWTRRRVGAEAAAALVLMLAPLAPFVAEELWREVLGQPDERARRSRGRRSTRSSRARSAVTLVVQVDGKVRDRLEVDAGADEDACARARAGLREGRGRSTAARCARSSSGPRPGEHRHRPADPRARPPSSAPRFDCPVGTRDPIPAQCPASRPATACRRAGPPVRRRGRHERDTATTDAGPGRRDALRRPVRLGFAPSERSTALIRIACSRSSWDLPELDRASSARSGPAAVVILGVRRRLRRSCRL